MIWRPEPQPQITLPGAITSSMRGKHFGKTQCSANSYAAATAFEGNQRRPQRSDICWKTSGRSHARQLSKKGLMCLLNGTPSYSSATGGRIFNTVTLRQSKPANSASNCAGSSRKTPSRITDH
jgi:hypothetical protein